MAERRRPEFVLTFEGPALESHQMAVADLAPALLALGEVFHEANAVANPGAPPVSLQIRAFDGGSFEIALSLGQSGIAEELARLLTGQDTDALVNLIALVTAGTGVFAAIRWLWRHVLVRQEPVQPGTTRFIGEDGTTLDVPSAVVELLQRPSVRRQARRVVEPLGREGVDNLRFDPPDGEALVLEAAEQEAFEVPESDETPIVDQTTEMALVVTVLSFAGGRKWRFTDGRMTFYADMADADFVRRIEADQESFARDDILRCRVRIRQWQTDSGLRTQYQIVQVLEHLSSVRTVPLQLPLATAEVEQSPRLTTHDRSLPQPSQESEGKD